MMGPVTAAHAKNSRLTFIGGRGGQGSAATERQRLTRVLGGHSVPSSCKALPLSGADPWPPLLPVHVRQEFFACAAVAGCIIAAGGYPQRKSPEVYDEVFGRCLRFPHDLPHDGGLHSVSSTFL